MYYIDKMYLSIIWQRVPCFPTKFKLFRFIPGAFSNFLYIKSSMCHKRIDNVNLSVDQKPGWADCLPMADRVGSFTSFLKYQVLGVLGKLCLAPTGRKFWQNHYFNHSHHIHCHTSFEFDFITVTAHRTQELECVRNPVPSRFHSGE